MNRNTTSKQILLVTVKNDVVGRATIDSLRASMKASKSPLRIVLYGRGHRFGKGRMHKCRCGVKGITPRACGCRWWDNSYQSNIPLSKAEKIAVFVTGRGNVPFDRY